MGDIMSFYIDRAANEAFISTATQRSSILAITDLLGYVPNQIRPAEADLVFTNNHPENAIIIPPRLQVSTASYGSNNLAPVVFETKNLSGVTLDAGDSVTITAAEGYTVFDEVLTSAFDGYASAEFTLFRQGVDVRSVEVYVEDVLYTQVPNLLEYDATDSVYKVTVDAEGSAVVRFGDGVGGRVPQLNAEIKATYRVTIGSLGNVLADTLSYVASGYTFDGGSGGSGLAVTNPSAAVGGTDPESTSSIRVNAPLSAGALSRAVSLADYSSLAIQVDGVSKANTVAEVYSNINLHIALEGDSGVDEAGDPLDVWQEVADSVSQFFLGKTPPGVTVTPLPPVMVPITIGINVQVSSAYKQDLVVRQVNLAIEELLSYEAATFGQRVTVQSISAALSRIAGIDYSQVVELYGHDDVPGLADVVLAPDELPFLDTLDLVAAGGINY
jgi:predicted phage baseplate assembly protein